MNRLSALLSLSSGDTSTIIPAPPAGGIAPGTGPADHVIVRIAVIRDLYASEDSRSESKLRSWMRAAGIAVDRCYFDEAHELCQDRLRAFDRLQVIVCVGNQALQMFTGHADITKRRGSVYEWEGKKVIGIISPGMVQRHKAFEVPCRVDCERVKALTTSHITHSYYCGCAVRRKRTHITPFNTASAALTAKMAEYILRARSDEALLSIDIETPKVGGKREVVCVGFAFSAEESLTLTWNEANYKAIELLINSPCQKVGHNFVSFDRWWLKRHGIDVGGRIFDSLCESHALNPAGRHSLDYLQSVCTWERYHKDEGKGHDITVIEKDYDSYYQYCGLDACLSWELHELFWPQLVARGLVPFYEQHYEALYDPILELMSRGVRIDHEYRETALYDLLQEAREARDTLGEINGAPLFTLTTKRDKEVYAALLRGNTDDLPYPPDLVAKSLETISKKTVSGAQLKVLLYEKMGLPPQVKRRSTGDETLTADSVTLRKLKIDYPEAARVIDLAQQHNKAQKLASFLYPGTFDDDGRFRFTLRLNTEASRFASSSAPNGTGRNCLLPDAEVLTPDGWVAFANLQPGTSVMQWHADGKLSFCVPSLHTYPFDGEMITADSWFHKNAYTPEHRIPLGGYNHSETHAISRKLDQGLVVNTATQVAQRRKTMIPISGYYEEGRATCSFIRLLVAAQADGSIEKYSIRFTFTKRRKIKRIAWLLDELGIPYTKQKAPEGYERFALSRQEPVVDLIACMLNQFPDCPLGTPKLFDWAMLNFDQKTLQAFVEETQYWDGSVRGRSWWYFCVEQQNTEIVSTMAHLCGYSSSTWTNVDNNRGYGSGNNKPLHYAKIKPRAYAITEGKHWGTKYHKGFVHCVTTPTGFFLCRYNGTICVTGNSQNSPRDKRIRRIMLPEKGHVLLEADLSQVEGRLCFIYTGDAELIRLARLRATEFDQHNFVVSILDRKPGTIFGVPLEELPAKSDERQAAKQLTHAFQRSMEAQTAVDTLLRTDERFVYTVDETQAMLDTLRRKLPAIPAWHAEIRKTIRRYHCLTSSWGHTWDVRYDELNDDLFRRAYSWKMQRDAAGLLNMQGFVPLYTWLKKEKMQSHILFQVHDSLVLSCVPEEAYDVAMFLKDHLEAPREYDGTELSVPVEFSVGKNYGDKIEMQELPDRATFERIALTCIA